MEGNGGTHDIAALQQTIAATLTVVEDNLRETEQHVRHLAGEKLAVEERLRQSDLSRDEAVARAEDAEAQVRLLKAQLHSQATRSAIDAGLATPRSGSPEAEPSPEARANALTERTTSALERAGLDAARNEAVSQAESARNELSKCRQRIQALEVAASVTAENTYTMFMELEAAEQEKEELKLENAELREMYESQLNRLHDGQERLQHTLGELSFMVMEVANLRSAATDGRTRVLE